MAYKLKSESPALSERSKELSVKTYQQYEEDIKNIRVLMRNAESNFAHAQLKEEWIELKNEFTGFKKAFEVLSLKIEKE